MGFDVVPGGLFGVLGGMGLMTAGEMGVVSGGVMVAGLMEFRGFRVVVGGHSVMMGCLTMMMRCLF